jgi:hypothetical protein
MLFGKQKNDKLSDAVSASYRLWNDKLVAAVRMAMPPECPYTVTHVGDMVGVSQSCLIHLKLLHSHFSFRLTQQLFSCVFVKSSQRENIHDITLVNCKTGMGGRYGNKGALLCRLVIDDTSLCFINCHLAAGQRAKLDRDRDLADIIETQAFSNLSTSSPGAYNLGGDGTAVFDHEICILSGDLNYRIDQVREAVVLNVMRKEFDKLLAQDQLLKGLVNNPSFRLRSFKEPPIRFAPTYKCVFPFNQNYGAEIDTILGGNLDTIEERMIMIHLRRNGFLPGAIESSTAQMKYLRLNHYIILDMKLTFQIIDPFRLDSKW